MGERFGGQILDTVDIENYISVPKTEGQKLAGALNTNFLVSSVMIESSLPSLYIFFYYTLFSGTWHNYLHIQNLKKLTVPFKHITIKKSLKQKIFHITPL